MAAAQTQPIGKAFIVYGTVKAVAANGTERLLAPNSPIFAGERIVTGPDGSVSVVFNDNAGHLELGRMSDVLMDQDVYAGAGPDQAADAVAQAAEIQAALENGEIDPTTQLPPPAAGAGVAGPRGGGRQIVVFEADQMEVLPDSGAETTGIGLDFLDPPGGVVTEPEEVIIPVIPPAPAPVAPEPPTPVPPVPPVPPDVVPLMTLAPIAGGVQEDALDNALSVGILDTAADTDTITMDLLPLVSVDFGGDEPGTIVFSLLDPNGAAAGLTSKGVAVVYQQNGNAIEAYAGDRLVFTFTLQPSGAAEFTLYDQVDHPAGAGDNALLTITNLGQYVQVTATDADGDAVTLPFTGLITVTVENDMPVLTLAQQAVSGAVQEDALGQATGNAQNNPDGDFSQGNLDTAADTDTVILQLSDLVNVAPGADEPASISYGITQFAGGVDSGYDSKGQNVLYYNEGGTLVARAGSATGTIVFTFSVNSDTGAATFNLNDQLDHPTGSGDNATLAITNLGQYVQVSVTDYDGDATSTNLGGLITVTVENDVPVLTLAQQVVSGAVQEDALGQTTGNAQNNPDGDFSQGNLDTAADTDTVILQLSDLVNVAPGADEPASISYGITQFAGGVVSGYDSKGQNVLYYNEAGTLVARAGSATGTVVFTFSVNSATGAATFNLNDQLDHTLGSGDNATLAITNLGQYVQVSVTDYDGDTTSTNLNGLIAVTVENDVPIRAEGAKTLEVQEDALGHAVDTVGSVADASLGNLDGAGDTDTAIFSLADLKAAVTDGADEPVAFSLVASGASGTVDGVTSRGQAITWSSNGSVVTAQATDGTTTWTVFEVAVDQTNGLTFDLDDQVDHSLGVNGTDDEMLVTKIDVGQFVLATDTDGDAVSLAGKLLVDVENDVPIRAEGAKTLEVQEDALGHAVDTVGSVADASLGNLDGAGDTDTAIFSLADLKAAVTDGADEPVAFSLVASGASGTVDGVTSRGQAITWSSNGSVVTAQATDGTTTWTVFEVAVDQTNGLTFDLDDQVDHSLGVNGTDDEMLVTKIDVGQFVLATDTDGDAVSLAGKLLVDVENDVPIRAEGAKTLEVQEDALGHAVDTVGSVADASLGNLDGAGDTDTAIFSLADLKAAVTDGADEPVAFSLVASGASGTVDGVTSRGQAITWSSNGSVVTAQATDGTTTWTVFEVAVDQTNGLTFDLDDQVDHSLGVNGTDDEMLVTKIDVGQFVLATDTDGDAVSLAGKLLVDVENDVPIRAEGAKTLEVQEDALGHAVDTVGSVADASLGNLDGAGDTDTAIFSLADLKAAVTDGADEPVAFSLVASGASGTVDGVTSRGQAITWSSNGSVVTAQATDGTTTWTVFEVAVDQTNGLTFDLDDQVDHSLGVNGTDDEMLVTKIDVGQFVLATDTDGDAVSLAGKLLVDVENDVPIRAEGAKTLEVQEDALGHAVDTVGSVADASLGNLDGAGDTDTAIFSLADLKAAVTDGADEPVAFSLVASGASGTVDGVTSRGQAITWSSNGSVVTAQATDGTTTWTVFEVAVDQTNGLTFDLDDQVDHSLGVNGTDDEMLVTKIDVGQFVLATDTDGDAVSLAGKLLVDVENDVPIRAEGAKTLEVQEDALGHAVDTVGSVADASLGNLDGAGDTDTAIFSLADLKAAVTDGADEPVAFSLVASGASGTVDGVTSRGQAITWSSNGSVVTAQATDGTTTWTVFEVAVDQTNGLTFDLDDQVDHSLGVNGTDDEMLVTKIDVGQFVLATDTDGDAVSLAGKLLVDVENDVPIRAEGAKTLEVQEDALGHAVDTVGSVADASLGNLDGAGDTDTAIFSLADLKAAVTDGADEPVAFSLVASGASGTVDGVTSRGQAITWSSNGSVVTAQATDGTTTWTVFEVAVDQTNGLTFDLDDQVDHSLGVNGTDDEMLVTKIDVGQFVLATDTDGDAVSLAGKLLVDVENDVPIRAEGAKTLEVQEDALGHAVDTVGSVADASLGNLDGAGDTDTAIFSLADLKAAVTDGADEPVAFSLVASGASGTVDGVTSRGQAITWSSNGSVVTAQATDGTTTWTVFEVAVDQTNGLTFDLDDQVDHSLGVNGTDDEMLVTKIDVGQFVLATDTDGDAVSLAGKLLVDVENDVPIRAEGAKTLEVQEDALGHAVDTVGSVADASLGNLDGAGDTDTAIFSLADLKAAVTDGADEPVAFSLVASGASGTVDGVTSRGQAITWSSNGSVVTAQATDGTTTWTVFEVAVDQTNGLTFDLDDQVDHSLGVNGTDDEMLVTKIDVGQFVLATDTDGDAVSLAGKLLVDVENDVPIRAEGAKTLEVQEDALGHAVDTVGSVADASLGNLDGAGDTDTAIFSLADLKAAVTDGADEPVAFSLVASGASGTVDGVTSRGQAITWSSNGSVVTAQATDGTTTWTVFEVAVDQTNGLTFDLDDQVDHSLGVNGTDDEMLVTKIDVGQFVLATDTDGDAVSLAGKLLVDVENDVPIRAEGAKTLEVQEDALGHAVDTVGSVADASLGNLDGAGDTDTAIFSLADLKAAVTDGADEPVAFSLVASGASGTVDGVTSRGQAITWSSNGSVVTAQATDGTTTWTVFEVAVDQTNGLTFDLDDQVDHSLGVNGTDDEMLVTKIDVGQFVLATDTDGDAVSLAGKLLVDVENDVPIRAEGAKTLEVQEDALGHAVDTVGSVADASLGNLDGAGDTDTAIFSLADLKAAVTDGADEPVAFSLVASGASGTVDGVTSRGQAITWSSNGSVVTAQATDGTTTWTVFEVAVDQTNGLTFDLDDQVDHSLGVNGTDDEMLVTKIDVGQFVLATDTDGDAVSLAGKLLVDVENDVPIRAEGAKTLEVQEDALGHAVDTVGSVADASLGNLDGAGDTDTAIFSLADLKAAVTDGADEPVAFSLVASGASGTVDGVTSRGQAITWSSNGSVVTGQATDGDTTWTVFEVALDQTNGLTFDLDDQVDHGGNDNDDEMLATKIDVGQFVLATDTDGDAVTLAGKLLVDVENDVPTLLVGNEAVIGRVYEDALGQLTNNPSNNPDTDLSTGIPEFMTMTDSVILQLAPLVSPAPETAPGADEPAPVVYSIVNPNSASSGLTSKGQAVTYQLSTIEPNTLLAVAEDGRTVFTFSVDEDSGVATFNLNDQLDHLGRGDDKFLTIQNLGKYVRASVTDADGDTATATFAGRIEIQVQNDVPVASDGQDSILANETFNSVTASLNYQAGADEEISDINLLLTNGAAVMSDKGQMTNDGQLLVWRDNGDGSWSAVNSTGVSSFTVKPDYDKGTQTYQGTYTVTIDGGLDGRGETTTIDFAKSINGGNIYGPVFGSAGAYLLAQGTKDGAAFDLNNNIPETVNFSAQGIGVAQGNTIDGKGVADATRISEVLSFKFYSSVALDAAGKLIEANSTTMDLTSATLVIDHFGQEETIYYTLWQDGSQVGIVQQSDGLGNGKGNAAVDTPLVVNSVDPFDEIRFEAGGNFVDNQGAYTESSFRIVSVSFESTTSGYDQTVIIPYQVTDFDGDSTTDIVAAAPTFSVTFDGDGRLDASLADAGVAISGGTGSETIVGSPFDDTIDGGAGDDTITGGDGDDTISGGTGADHLDGGIGSDTLSYTDDTSGVTVNLATNSATGGEATGDTITGFENVTGGTGADTLTGNASNNVLDGNAGNDTIFGGDGDDTISGGAGADQLNGGTGSDTLSYADDTTGVNVNLATNSATGGEATGDTVTGFENVSGGTGADTLTGNASNNVLSGNAGNDTIAGGAGNDTLFGGEGDDTLSGEADNDVLVGGAGADTLNGGAGNDTLFAGEETDGDGQDTVTGGDGADLFVDVNNDDDAAGGDIAADFGTGADENLDTLVPPPEPTV